MRIKPDKKDNATDATSHNADNFYPLYAKELKHTSLKDDSIKRVIKKQTLRAFNHRNIALKYYLYFATAFIFVFLLFLFVIHKPGQM